MIEEDISTVYVWQKSPIEDRMQINIEKQVKKNKLGDKPHFTTFIYSLLYLNRVEPGRKPYHS